MLKLFSVTIWEAWSFLRHGVVPAWMTAEWQDAELDRIAAQRKALETRLSALRRA